MKEFIEKLIGRLEERIKSNIGWEDEPYFKGECMAYEDAIEIVNQLAEEYKGKYVSKDEVGYMLDTIEMRGDETWMDYYRKALKGLCELSGKEYNNGWISVEQRLPEVNQEVLVFDAISGNSIECLAEDEAFIGTVLAWMPIAPYQPKGE